jgi:hypothetical protein
MTDPEQIREPSTPQRVRAVLRSWRTDALLAFLFSCICLPLVWGVESAYSLGHGFRALSLLLLFSVVFAILYFSSLFTQVSRVLRIIALLGISFGITFAAFLVSSFVLFILWARSAP